MLYIQAIWTVFSRPYYLLIATVVAIIVFSLAVWLPSFPLIWIVSKNASVNELLSLLWSLYGAIGTNFSVISATYTIAISILFGMNIALLTYYIQKMKVGVIGLRSTGASGVGGLISGLFGLGCAACGTFVFTSVLTIFGVGGMLAYLPFGGEEFGFLGVGLLGYSLYSLSRKITDPLVCPI